MRNRIAEHNGSDQRKARKEPSEAHQNNGVGILGFLSLVVVCLTIVAVVWIIWGG
jgi:hypothetical protein